MSKLNCSVGDLAITVFCNLPENVGNIVRIKSGLGFIKWGPKREPLYSWDVEVATEHGWLAYEYSGYFQSSKCGPVPDKYLRRITPPKGYLTDEFADSEQLQIDFHCIEPALIS